VQSFCKNVNKSKHVYIQTWISIISCL